MNKKAWKEFNRLCNDLIDKGVLESRGKSIRLTAKFRLTIMQFLLHPANTDGEEARKNNFAHYFRTCILAALVKYYEPIEPDLLESRWEIVDSLVLENEKTVFKESMR